MTQAEEYEVPGIRRRVEQQAAADAAHWISLGFTLQDVVGGVHALRGAVIDVLLDALVQDEMPSFGDSLDQLKVLDAFLDRLVLREHDGKLKGRSTCFHSHSSSAAARPSTRSRSHPRASWRRCWTARATT